ncbi:hypothetical protein [Halioxenophilus sp. WMMB6]|uniref:hypothetical protein n=1 Tax=Halioxenophilus sp. WMMB6 TaxID=3073815 RepID=UPI00295F0C0E|nr:hypothetical protein [Halioxenophilus sp. WMMB6]
MLVQKYKDEGYLFNVNLTGSVGDAEVYRGDLVLVFGEKTERGDYMPPIKVAKQAVLYIVGGKTKMLIAGLYELQDMELVAEHFKADCDDDLEALFFVHNIKEAMVVSFGGITAKVVPLDDGMIFNEALELLCIEKSDLKGQSAEEKVETVYGELKSFKFKGPEVSWEEALSKTVEAKHTARGPV